MLWRRLVRRSLLIIMRSMLLLSALIKTIISPEPDPVSIITTKPVGGGVVTAYGGFNKLCHHPPTGPANVSDKNCTRLR